VELQGGRYWALIQSRQNPLHISPETNPALPTIIPEAHLSVPIGHDLSERIPNELDVEGFLLKESREELERCDRGVEVFHWLPHTHHNLLRLKSGQACDFAILLPSARAEIHGY